MIKEQIELAGEQGALRRHFGCLVKVYQRFLQIPPVHLDQRQTVHCGQAARVLFQNALVPLMGLASHLLIHFANMAQ